jgi:drug/metabolite transporter (DMT)-like permease
MVEYNNFTLFTILFVAIWILLQAVCQITVKGGINQLKEIQEPTSIFDPGYLSQVFSNKLIVIGFLLYLLSTIFWFGALSKLDISLLSPLGSLIFVMVALFALVFLGERVSPLRWTAIFIIVGGVFLLVRS